MSDDADRSFEYRRFRRLGTKVDVWALSSEADVAKDIFAAVASDGKLLFSDLRDSVQNGTLEGWDIDWVARLARVLALQPHEAELHNFALMALKLSVPELPQTPATLPVRKILLEMLLRDRDTGASRELLARDLVLSTIYHGYLGVDLINPFVTADWDLFDEWLIGFNAPFVAEGLSAVSVDPDSESPFDSLGSTVESGTAGGPLVSVIITTFNPDPSEIWTSVHSILQQTWANLEVLLIDDHSEEISIGVLEDLASEDPRVMLVRQPINGGTYRARNAGIRLASGKYVTGQDTDDWSHPERIARQVEALEANPESPGVTTAANRTDDRLSKVALGNHPHRRCEVSLMLPVETAVAIGGYLPVRKAADSEFRERLETWCGKSVTVLPEPLYIIRMSPGSLSRADFRPGWSHHARRGFWSAYKDWHARAEPDELCIDPSSPRLAVPSTAPQRIAGREWPQGTYNDVCLVADWRSDSAEQRAAIDELRSLLDADLDVAILHFDTPWGGTPRAPRALIPEVQQLVSRGQVRRVFADDEVEIGLMVVRDPAAVDYARRFPSTLKVDKVLMVGHGNHVGRRDEMRPYDPPHSDSMARTIFGRDPIWLVPRGQDGAGFGTLYALPMCSEPYPIVVDVERFGGTRLVRSGERLVVGRAANNDISEWPDGGTIQGPYPTDGSVELRVLGDARGAVRVLGERRLPVDWLQFRNGEVAPEQFWRTIDAAVVYDDGKDGQYLERPVLEALAAGAPVVTDATRAEYYAGVVLGAPPGDALESVRNLLADPELMQDYRVKGRQFVEELSPPGALLDFLRRQLAENCAGAERDV